MSVLLDGMEGVGVESILVYGMTQDEHDDCLLKVLRRLEAAGLTLSQEKCKFSRSDFDKTGVHPDSAMVKAIQQVPTPKNVGDICSASVGKVFAPPC